MLGGVATCWFSFGKSNTATLWQWLCWTATPPSTTLHGAAWPCVHWQRGSTASSGHYPVGPTPTHEKLLGSRVLCMPDQRTPFWPLSVTGPLFSAPPSYSFCQTPPSVGPTPATCHVGVCHVQDQIASAPAAVLATTNSKPTLPLTL